MKNYSFQEAQCCVCERSFELYYSLEYVVTKSGLYICADCIDKLARENRKKSNFWIRKNYIHFNEENFKFY